MTNPKQRGGARKGTGPKGPHGREIKKTYSIGMYPSQVEQLVKKHDMTWQAWLNSKIDGEGLAPPLNKLK